MKAFAIGVLCWYLSISFVAQTFSVGYLFNGAGNDEAERVVFLIMTILCGCAGLVVRAFRDGEL